MKPFLYQRLTQALLAELASGAYREGESFLSLRRICRLWNVSEPTARSSIALLREAGLLHPLPRSGYRLEIGFQKRALLLLHTSPGTSLPPASTWLDKRWRLLRAIAPESKRRIGLVLEDHEIDVSRGSRSDLAALEATRTFFQAANADGCDVLYFYQDGTPATEDFIFREIKSTQLDGVVIFRRFRTQHFGSFLRRLAANGIPAVTVFDDCAKTTGYSLNFNNIGAGFSAARSLLEDNPRRLVGLLPSHRIENFEQRFEGLLLGMKELGGAAAPDVEVLRVPPTGKPVTELRAVFTSRRDRPTGIFAPGISTFIDLKERAIREGWRIPRRTRIVGCGNPNLLKKDAGNFELLALDFSEAGRRAYQHVRKIVDGEPVERMVLLPVPYIGVFQGKGRKAEACV